MLTCTFRLESYGELQVVQKTEACNSEVSAASEDDGRDACQWPGGSYMQIFQIKAQKT